MSSTANTTGVVPASLAFLAIYNPSLSKSDDSLHDEIVYFFESPQDELKERNLSGAKQTKPDQDKKNKQMRSVGLAQAMIQFSG